MSFEMQANSWRNTLWLTYGAVGVALGDLGTSPIYTLSSVFHGACKRMLLLYACFTVVLIRYPADLVMTSALHRGQHFLLLYMSQL